MISPGEPASLKFILIVKGGGAGAPRSLCPLKLLLESQPGCQGMQQAPDLPPPSPSERPLMPWCPVPHRSPGHCFTPNWPGSPSQTRSPGLCSHCSPGTSPGLDVRWGRACVVGDCPCLRRGSGWVPSPPRGQLWATWPRLSRLSPASLRPALPLPLLGVGATAKLNSCQGRAELPATARAAGAQRPAGSPRWARGTPRSRLPARFQLGAPCLLACPTAGSPGPREGQGWWR